MGEDIWSTVLDDYAVTAVHIGNNPSATKLLSVIKDLSENDLQISRIEFVIGYLDTTWVCASLVTKEINILETKKSCILKVIVCYIKLQRILRPSQDKP